MAMDSLFLVKFGGLKSASRKIPASYFLYINS